MTFIRYVASVKARNVRAELRVNDVPVAMYAPGEAEHGAEVPLNEFLVRGTNQVTVTLNANPIPSRFLQPWSPTAEPKANVGQPAQFEATVIRQEDREVARSFAPVRLNWSGICQPQPDRVERNFEVDTPFPPWMWLRARELQPSEAAAAYQALRALHGRLEQGDGAGFAAIMEAKIQEVTQGAYGLPPDPLRNSFVKALGRSMSDPTRVLLPCNPADVDLRLVGQRRLVQCLRPDGRHALTYAKGGVGSALFLPVMLGIVDSKWQVLR